MLNHIVVALLFSMLTMHDASLLAAERVAPSKSKQALIDQIKHWVADEKDIAQSQIKVSALDRRLKVPDCPQPFAMSFPYENSSQSVRVDCLDTGWKAFIRVIVEPTGDHYIYARDLSRDTALQRDDIVMKADTSASHAQGLVTKLDEIENHSLKRSVTAGQLVQRSHLSPSVPVFKLRRDVLAGELITESNVEESTLPASKTMITQRLSKRRIQGAVATRDLAAGKILHQRDVRQRQRALIAQVTLTRGQVLSDNNARIQDYLGTVPTDALTSNTSMEQLEVTRTIQAGSVLRMSDVKVAALIHKGDTVTLSVRGGALLITVAMEALESGKLGEQIDLLNPESGETVTAVVSGTGRANRL
ncbi:MAG TPA: flagella basal body P-ring formation protein FlgA [Porticoccaceae bacterium]|nr:flagella basal body P-ring formation protein FlgA [Porticoccaceae bacterium]